MPDPLDPYAGDDFAQWYFGQQSPLQLSQLDPSMAAAAALTGAPPPMPTPQDALLEPGITPAPPMPAPTPVPPAMPAVASTPPVLDPTHPLTAPGMGIAAPAPEPAVPPPAPEPVPQQPSEYAQPGGALGAIGDVAAPQFPADVFNVPGEEAAGKALADLRVTDPERAAMLEAKRNIAKQNEYAARQFELATKQKQDAEASWQAFQDANQRTEQKMADIESDAKALAARKIVKPTPGVAEILLGVIGGIIQGQKGGENQGLAMVKQAVDRDIDLQKTDIENGRADLNTRRGIVAEEFARHGDLFRAGEAARAAAYERNIQQLQVDMQNYDPRGTTVAAYANTITGLRQAQAQALMNARKNALDEQTKLTDLALKRTDLAKKQAALMGMGRGTPGIDEKAVRPASEWAAAYGISDPRIATLPSMTGKQFKDIVGGGYELQSKQAQAGQIERERGALPLFDEKGERIAFEPHGSTPKVDEFRAKAASTQEMVNLLDQAMAVRTGWSSDVGNSDEKQRLNAIMGKIKLAAKNAETLGAISDSDVGLINGLVGAKDFSQFRDVKAGVDQARQNLVDSVRTAAVGAGMPPKEAARIAYPNVWQGKAPPTDVEKQRIEDINNPSHALRGPTGDFTKRDPTTGKVLFE